MGNDTMGVIKKDVFVMLEILDMAEALCVKFINKVESGRARSKETYKECKELLEKIESLQKHTPNSEFKVTEKSCDGCKHKGMIFEHVPCPECKDFEQFEA